MIPRKIPALVALLACCVSAPVWAAAEEAKLPRFVSLKQSEVYMREGPSAQNRVKWIYHRKGLPVEVIATYDVWRRVRDPDGDIGWINAAMLSRERAALVQGQGQIPLREKLDAGSEIVAQVAPGAVGKIERCEVSACELRFDKTEGWMDRSHFWGVYADEKF